MLTTVDATSFNPSEHWGIAWKQASYCTPTASADLEDFCAAAMAELCRVADQYDPGRGAPSTFAAVWARHGARRARQNAAGPVRVPVYAQENGVTPGHAEPFDDPAGPGDAGIPWNARIADPTPSPEDLAAVAERRRLVQAAVDALPGRERCAVRLRWGLSDGRRRTLRAVGEAMGLSGERVRQVLEGAYVTLRVKLANGLRPRAGARA